MKKNSVKKETKHTPQLDLFEQSEKTTYSSSNQVETYSKVVSLIDFKQQQEIRQFYEVANKLTAHLK